MSYDGSIIKSSEEACICCKNKFNKVYLEELNGRKYCNECLLNLLDRNGGNAILNRDKHKKEISENPKEKNCILAFLLSSIFCGIGQIYNGDIGKGIMLIVIFMIGLYSGVIYISLGASTWSIMDAYLSAKKL